MFCRISKLTLILTAILTLITLVLSNPSKAFAQTLIFQDNFDDNYIDNNWRIGNYTQEVLGSYSIWGQLNTQENNQQLRIFGSDILSDKYYNGKIVGWFGKALATNSGFSPEKKIIVNTNVNIYEGNSGYIAILLMEFDENNRIMFNIGDRPNTNIKASQLGFIENGSSRCVGSSLENENFSGCINIPMNFSTNTIYNLKIAFDNETKVVTGFINDNIIHMGTFNGNISDFHAGIASAVRYDGNYIDARFDDFKIYSGASETTLNVPDIKQFTPQWANLEYDYASNWYPANPTISRWGCALTSASMLLKYYGHDINPDALNEWLSYQKDGYTRNGGIMWTAVSRLTELRNSGNPDWPILEFCYLNYSEDKLKEEMQNERPSILKLTKPIYDSSGNIKSYSTHFIVGKGYNNSDIFVNDPGSINHTTLDQAESFWGTTRKIGRFNKSETDLSYIVLFVDDSFNLEVSSENEAIEGDEYYFTEEPFTNPDDPEPDSGLETLNAFYYPKPESGEYTVKVKGTGIYQLEYFIYDKEGSVQKGNSFGAINENQPDNYLIEFDKENSEDSMISEITFNSVISFWEDAYQKGLIENNGLYTSVNRLLGNAYKMLNKNTDATKSLLGEIIYILDEFEELIDSDNLITYLKYQVNYLLTSV